MAECTDFFGNPLPDYLCRWEERNEELEPGDGSGGGDLDCSTEALETIPGRYYECYGPLDTGSWDIDYTPEALRGGYLGVPWLGWILIAALVLAILRSGGG